MQTYEQQTLRFGGDASTSSRGGGDSPASRSRLPANEEARKTTATSGRRCSEQYARFVPNGSWARMFTDSLIGRTDWFSTRCALTWKMQATRSGRLYFRLLLSALPTAGTGCGLLPTVQTQGLKRCENGRTVFFSGNHAADSDGNRRRKRTHESKPVPECVGTSDAGNGCENRTPADPDGERCDECQSSGQSEHPQERNSQGGDAERRIPGWGGFPTQSPVCGGDDGISAELDGITFPAWRRESIKAFGNAIVPQVAWRIFDAINKLNR